MKNDPIDAYKLATFSAGGLLTGVDVPDEELGSTRALLRCRAALVEELGRSKKRATQFLQTRGYTYRGGSNWSQKLWEWLARTELGAADQIVLDMHVDLIAVRPSRSLAATAREFAGFLWEAMNTLTPALAA